MSQGTHEITYYDFHPSYFSQMGRLALVEAGVPFTRKPINILKSENYDPSYVKINPACEVPAMAVDGKIINGSQAILDYAAKQKGGSGGPAEDLRKRCYGLPMDALSAGLLMNPDVVPGFQMSPGIKGAYEALGNRPQVLQEMIKKHPECKDAYEDKLKRVQSSTQAGATKEGAKKALQDVEKFLDDLDKHLGSSGQWLGGNEFSNADVVVAVLLGRLELLGLNKYLFGEEKRKNVVSYYQRLKERPSVKQELVWTFG